MLDGIVLLMMCAIWFGVFIQDDSDRFMVAAIFTAPLLAHDLIFHTVLDSVFYYYLSAGFIDLMVIMAIASMSRFTALSGDLQVISLVSIVYNFIGWILFTSGIESTAYSMMYILLYAWVIYAMYRGEPENGGYRADSRLFAIHPHGMSRRIIHTNH